MTLDPPEPTDDLDALAARAARFPLAGPIHESEAWDALALADYAVRTKIPLPKRWGKRIDRAGAMLVNSDTIVAFRMKAAAMLVQYHLHMTRIHLDLSYHPSPEELRTACARFDFARQNHQRKLRKAYLRRKRNQA